MYEKLELLDKMLEMTEKLQQNPLRLDQEGAQRFSRKLGSLMTEVNKKDRAIVSITQGKQEGEADEARAAVCKIESATKRLMKANSDMIASIKSRQEIIGGKIAQLKQKKDFLDNCRFGSGPKPSLVDSTV